MWSLTYSKVARLVVDADLGRGDPGGEFARLGDTGLHQRLDEIRRRHGWAASWARPAFHTLPPDSKVALRRR